jgi:hypothetical protein
MLPKTTNYLEKKDVAKFINIFFYKTAPKMTQNDTKCHKMTQKCHKIPQNDNKTAQKRYLNLQYYILNIYNLILYKVFKN